MYPEGILINQEGTKILSFKKDPMNPMNEGFIESWLVDSNNSKEFRFRKRLSKMKALEQWNYLSANGWAVLEEKELAA